MRNVAFDLSCGVFLELVLAEGRRLVARWLWCDLLVGWTELGVA